MLFSLSGAFLGAIAFGCSSGGSSGSSSTGGAGNAGVGGASGGNAGGSGGNPTGIGGGLATGGNGGVASGGGSGTAGSGGANAGKLPTIGGCAMFTTDDAWNRDIYDSGPDAGWTQRLQNLVGAIKIHPDFGGQGAYGIPINVVPQSQPMAPITFDSWPDESDPGPYPFPGPTVVSIEGNSPTACSGDCHLLVVQQGTCMLYEGYACESRSDGWHCANGAKWDLTQNSYGQRPMGWTSADAAGLPIAAGILRYDEVVAGAVTHAIRFTVHCTIPQYVAPATHEAVPPSCDPANPDAPPMGLRVRLKKTFATLGLRPNVQVILTAMQHYGMILADNGSDFYFQGDADPRWDDLDLTQLKAVPASEFEVVAPVPPLMP